MPLACDSFSVRQVRAHACFSSARCARWRHNRASGKTGKWIIRGIIPVARLITVEAIESCVYNRREGSESSKTGRYPPPSPKLPLPGLNYGESRFA